jgi:hydrogenase maturation protease
MSQTPARCLILACGNTLRGDDGVGLWLADWAEKRFREQAGVRVIADHQWTPELAEDVSRAASVLFIDCSVNSLPGSVTLAPVLPAANTKGMAAHHLGAQELLALGHELYHSLPANALSLTIGAGSIELGEVFSDPVNAALPDVCTLIEETVLRLIARR